MVEHVVPIGVGGDMTFSDEGLLAEYSHELSHRHLPEIVVSLQLPFGHLGVYLN